VFDGTRFLEKVGWIGEQRGRSTAVFLKYDLLSRSGRHSQISSNPRRPAPNTGRGRFWLEYGEDGKVVVPGYRSPTLVHRGSYSRSSLAPIVILCSPKSIRNLPQLCSVEK
jgi:hypothetical protein